VAGDTRTWGICGGSGAGKTYLVNQVVRQARHDVAVVPFDAYYHDLADLTRDERAAMNFDHPDSLDVELFVLHLMQLAAGEPAEVPVYDFANHTRTGETITVEPAELVVTEGILLFSFPAVLAQLDLAIYLEAPAGVRLDRRVARDTVERGRFVGDVERQWAETVAPMHDQFVAPHADNADLTVPFGHERDVLLEDLFAQLVV